MAPVLTGDSIEQTLDQYIKLFGSGEQPDVPSEFHADTVNGHAETALGHAAPLDSATADDYRSAVSSAKDLADILSGLDASSRQLIIEHAQENAVIRAQLQELLDEYRRNKAALKDALDTPQGQAMLAAMQSNTLTRATTLTQEASIRAQQRAGNVSAIQTDFGSKQASIPKIAAPPTSTNSSRSASFIRPTAATTGTVPRPVPSHTSGGGGGYRVPQLFSNGGSGATQTAPPPAISAEQAASNVAAIQANDGPMETSQRNKAVELAKSQLGLPYAWGGGDLNGPTTGIRDGGTADSYGDYQKVGFDCSGYARWVIANATDGAIVLPRTTYEMVNVGVPISASELQPGDLIFPNPGHVQIYIGDGQVAEAQQSGTNLKISPVGEVWQARRYL